MSRPTPLAYRTKNWSAYNEALKWRSHRDLRDIEGVFRHGTQPLGNRSQRSSARFNVSVELSGADGAEVSLPEPRRDKVHCAKLLGQRLMARDFDRRVAEFQVRVAVLNAFTALGMPVTEAVG